MCHKRISKLEARHVMHGVYMCYTQCTCSKFRSTRCSLWQAVVFQSFKGQVSLITGMSVCIAVAPSNIKLTLTSRIMVVRSSHAGETGPAQRERLPQPASTGNMALMEGLTIGRGALNGFILNLHKMEKGFVAPGKQGKIGIRDDDPVFGDILNAISARSSDTQFYLFSSAVDLECGRRLVPEELQKPLPPLVAQLAGLAQPQDQAAGYTDADRLEQIARGAGQDQLGEPQAAGKRKRAPAKGRKTGGAKQR